MKTLKTSLLTFLLISFSLIGFAQTKSEKFPVAGECGMCKGKIEKAAKAAGATYAVWDVDAKELNVKYKNGTASAEKIQEAIAAVGYDTPKYKATDEAYNKLHGCCKYERKAAATTAASVTTEAHACCDDKKCADHKCMKDGKCEKDMSCCKDSGCSEKDCCKKD